MEFKKKILLLIFFVSYINSSALERIENKIKKYEEKIKELELKNDKNKKITILDILYKNIIYAYKKKIIAFEDKIFIIFETGIYLVNEKRILQYKKKDFGKNLRYQIFEKYENGKKKLFIVNSKINRCFIIGFLYTGKMLIDEYFCEIPENVKIFISHNLLIYSKDKEVIFQSFENRNLVKLGSQKFDNTLKILNIKKFEKIYYLFTDKEVYYIDNYSLTINHVLTHPEEIETVSILYTEFGSFIVYKIKNKDYLIFEQVMKNLQFRKALRWYLKGELIFINKKFLIQKIDGVLRIFKLLDILKEGDKDYLEFNFFLDHQKFLSISDEHNYSLYFLSENYGIIKYSNKIVQKKQNHENIFKRIYKNSNYFVFPCIISFIVIYFSYGSFNKKKEKKLLDKNKILKARLTRFMKKNKKTIDDINKKTKLVEKDLAQFIKEVKEE